MKLERHVGGLSRVRKEHYLRSRGWTCDGALWASPRLGLEGMKLHRAIHHQLTEDLCTSMVALGWEVVGFSERGYAKLRREGVRGTCSLPKALRVQARREKRPVAELTYSLFLSVLLQAES